MNLCVFLLSSTNFTYAKFALQPFNPHTRSYISWYQGVRFDTHNTRLEINSLFYSHTAGHSKSQLTHAMSALINQHFESDTRPMFRLGTVHRHRLITIIRI